MRRYELIINDQPVTVNVKSVEHGESKLEVDGVTYTVRLSRQDILPSNTKAPSGGSAPAPVAAAPAPAAAAPAPAMKASAGGPGLVAAPIPGAVLEVFVKVGDKVAAGDPILKMEAMKMENTIAAPVAGTVASVAVAKGAVVDQGQELAVIA
jgi:biotin carboxyl carrier protein